MDIRLGDLICPLDDWVWWERMLANYLARNLQQPGEIFDGSYLRKQIARRGAAKGLRASISRLRDRYMRDIYSEVTVNTSHLASRAILKSVENGSTRLPLNEFKHVIYVAIKKLQKHRHVHLHRSICNPSVYRALLKSETPELTQFLQSAENAGLIETHPDEIRFRDKLAIEHEFDSVRLENPIEVYANEIEPVAEVDAALDAAIAEIGSLDAEAYARYVYDDELVAYEWDKGLFDGPAHREINARETATADARPFLLEPAGRSAMGVLLIHGFLASPAEVRPLGDKLFAAGHTVLGVRLKGHGTSPWDLRERRWEDWLASVERGLHVLRGICDNVCIIGFSTGGALALLLAARAPDDVSAVASICAPLKFRAKNMRFVPLMHGANRIVRWVSKYEGLMPFRPNESEHPHINYRNMPIRGLYELTRLVTRLRSELPKVSCPVSIVQSAADHVVDPVSATLAYDLLTTEHKEIHWVESERHGIVNEAIGNTHEVLLKFVTDAATRSLNREIESTVTVHVEERTI